MAQWIRLLAPELPDPLPEYRFAAMATGGVGPGVRRRLAEANLRDWRLDLAWMTAMPDYSAAKIGVECHGGVYSHGRHTRGVGFTKDREKFNEATLMGWIILEFTGEHINNDPDYCIDCIRRAFKLRRRGFYAYHA